MDILTIGDSSIDLFMKVEETSVESGGTAEHPQICFYHGSKIPVEHFETSIAGNAVNVSVGCSMLGHKVGIYTELGDDDGADRIIKELEGFGVDTKFCKKNPGQDTNLHSVIVYRGERTIFSHHGKKDYALQGWDKPKWIYYTSLGKGFEKFQGELVGYIKGEGSGIGTAFNPGTQQMKEGIGALRDILAVTDVLFVNKAEAEQLTGGSTGTREDLEDLSQLEILHQELRKLGPKLTVITLGTNGATCHDGTTMVVEPAFTDDRPVVDKTGAGDAFSSGFLSAIVHGKPMKTALRWGAINSGNVIKEIGSIRGLVDAEKMAGM